MEVKKHFPNIRLIKTSRGFMATAGLTLKHILKGDLFLQDKDIKDDKIPQLNPLQPKNLHSAREAFLKAISLWTQGTTLELHITALPSLAHKAMGQLWINMFIYEHSDNELIAKEQLVSRYLSFMPLLSTYTPEAVFIPITDDDEFMQRSNPFVPTHAITIHRYEEKLSLAAPLRRTHTGFGTLNEIKRTDKFLVNYRFPWTPSLDDWARLMNVFICQIDPLKLIIRIRPVKADRNIVSQLEKTVKTCEDFLSREKESQITLSR